MCSIQANYVQVGSRYVLLHHEKENICDGFFFNLQMHLQQIISFVPKQTEVVIYGRRERVRKCQERWMIFGFKVI